MIGRVAGKIIVVTGAGQGQGAAEARLLAAEGATVIAVDLGDSPIATGSERDRTTSPGRRPPASRTPS